MSIVIKNNYQMYVREQRECKNGTSIDFKGVLSDVSSNREEQNQTDNIKKQVQQFEVDNEYANIINASKRNRVDANSKNVEEKRVDGRNPLIEVQSPKYRITPRANEPYVDIYDGAGNKLGVFATSDLNIKVDSYTGNEILISSHGTAAYDAIPMTAELKEDLCKVLDTDYLESEELKGYSIKTHSETGIQYVLRDGEEGRGGRILIRNEVEQQRFDALAEKYMKKYPNLISDSNAAVIYADLEIRGLAKSTETGIVTMGWNGASYRDNNDVKKNWAMEFTEDVFKRIDEWIKNHREFMDKIDRISAWNDMFESLGSNYDRIWSDEELKQGYLYQQ